MNRIVARQVMGLSMSNGAKCNSYVLCSVTRIEKWDQSQFGEFIGLRSPEKMALHGLGTVSWYLSIYLSFFFFFFFIYSRFHIILCYSFWYAIFELGRLIFFSIWTVSL